MPVKIILRDKDYQLEANITVRKALAKINISPETVLVTRNGELITEDEFLREGDIIKLIAVISGGSSEHNFQLNILNFSNNRQENTFIRSR